MEKRFKCNYCGRVFENPIPHKCTGGFRKHHLKFTNLNPNPREQIRDLCDSLGMPRMEVSSLADYILEKYKIGISITATASMAWIFQITTLNGELYILPEYDSSRYKTNREALERGVIGALKIIKLNGLRGEEN